VVNRSTIGYWTTRMTVSETGKVDVHHLRFSTSQLDSWHSLYQSAKEMLETFDNLRCAQGGFLGASQSNTEPREKLSEKPSYLDIYSR